MLTLKIQNHEIETIFLEGFNSNKEMFFDFVKQVKKLAKSYKKIADDLEYG